MGILQAVRDWLNSFGSSGGGKRLSEYRTHTDDGQPILIEAQETVIGNNEAMAFFRDICGGSIKEIMLRAGATNIPREEGEEPPPRPVRAGDSVSMGAFRRLGVRVSDEDDVPVFAKPGTYPHVELVSGNVREEDTPTDGRPLVIRSSETDRSRAMHATVVLTVFDAKRQSKQKQVTVHFHGRGVIRAKGFSREVGAMSRPSHYDGEEIRRLIGRNARKWAGKIHWCSALERY
jgi:hypothetical protein